VTRTAAVQSLTALPRSPQQDRISRMRKYSIAMSVRMVCLIAVVLVPDWWRLVFGAGAIFLPYVAVVLANVGSTAASTPVHPEQLGPLAIEAARPVPQEQQAP
jgi:uncharacterized membrane protein YdjX (TVP38/TMEM64 family)